MGDKATINTSHTTGHTKIQNHTQRVTQQMYIQCNSVLITCKFSLSFTQKLNIW